MNIELINQLWKKTKVENKCWLWTGHLHTTKQGVVWLYGKNFVVSRLSLCIYLKLDYDRGWWQANHIDSICKHRHCWNPLHLYVGSQGENIKDSVIRGTHFQSSKMYCKRGHEFTKENTIVRGSVRRCRACNNIRSKAGYARKNGYVRKNG